MNRQLRSAVNEYHNRQSRITHPRGNFDNGGRFYPGNTEHCTCCDKIRSPSRRFPYSLLTHCRTILHIAHLYGVDYRELRDAIRKGKRHESTA